MADSRRPIEATGIGSVDIKNEVATTGQTWVRGAVLVAASGLISEGGADPTAIVGVSTHAVTSSAAGAVAQFVRAVPGQEFVMSIDTSAAIGTGAIVATDKYLRYGITEDSDGIWYVDKNKTTDAAARVTVTDFVDPVGEVMGRVKVVFHQHGDLGGTPLAITVYAGSV
jgi:hypothetical protein